MKVNSDLRRLIKRARELGWTVELARAGHLKWRGPDGQLVVSSSTPSDRRVQANVVAELRRKGCPL